MRFSLTHFRNLFGVYLKPQRARVALLALLLVTITALQVWSPQLLRQFIDAASATSTPRTLLTLAALFLVAALVTQVAQVGATYVSELVGWTATNRLRRDLARHCLGLDRAFHNGRTPGEMIERIDGDVTALATFFSQFVLQVIGNLLLLIGVLAALFLENVLVGATLTVFALAALVTLVAIRAIAVQDMADEREARAEMFGLIEERLAGLDDVRANGGGDYAMKRLDDVTRVVQRTGTRAAIRSSLIWMTTMGIFALGYTLALALGALLFFRGTVTIGTVFLFFQYTDALRRPLEQLSEQLRQFQAAAASSGRIGELRAMRSSISDGPGCMLPDGALDLEFRNVSFAYEVSDKRGTMVDETISLSQPQPVVLNNISFMLAPGRVLGVIGRTGSGKTTLTRLIFRLHDVQRGAILLGGRDVRELTLEQLRGRVGIVTQDVQLFEATVRDNLTMFDDRIPDERVHVALHELGLGAWLNRLPDGLDHVLAGGGASLSAGEAQLIAFGRVFLRDPGLVILDEASSRLDPATEHLIECAVNRLFAGRTGIVIAHRLGTIRRADDVLLLHHGQMQEYGARATLAADEHSRFAALLRAGMEEVLA